MPLPPDIHLLAAGLLAASSPIYQSDQLCRLHCLQLSHQNLRSVLRIWCNSPRKPKALEQGEQGGDLFVQTSFQLGFLLTLGTGD